MATQEAVLGTDERVTNALRLGESHFREFKSARSGEPGHRRARAATAICKDVAEALVAFANADGGELLVGVEDDGEISGVKDDPAVIDTILRAPETHVHKDTPISPLKAKVSISGEVVLYFAIEKGTRYVHHTSDGRCLQRRDRATVPVASEQIRFERQEQASREYDRAFVDGATCGDLDTGLVGRAGTQIGGGMSAEKCLQVLGLAEYATGSLRIRRAALLLFGKHVDRWHPRSEVRIMRVNGTEVRTAPNYNVMNYGTERENILSLVSKAWERLRAPGLLVETKFSADGIFEERIMYPEEAVREALINAIAHRDYSIEGRGIEVVVFDDRMEIRSPGALLSTITLEELRKTKGVHESRNAFVARTLREIGYMREMGEGMRRIFYLMRVNDLVPPDLQADQESFTITLYHRSVFSDADQRWIDGFDAFSLTREEKRVVLLGKGGNLLSPKQIWETLDLVDTEVYRSIVYGLQVKGILVSEFTSKAAHQAAQRRRVSARSVGRFRIRTPQECEGYLAQLLQCLGSVAPEPTVPNSTLRNISDMLPVGNTFKRPLAELGASLRTLGLLDDERRPAGKLLALWRPAVTRPARPEGELGTRQGVAGAPDAPRIVRALDFGEEELVGQAKHRDIFVGNLDYGTTEADLRQLFSQYGPVEGVTIPLDYLTGQSRGFAFVNMPSMRDATKAVEDLGETVFRGRPLHLGWAHRPSMPARGV